jgi:hypothetical protein
MIQKFVVPLFALIMSTLAWSQSPAQELARLLKQKGVISQSDLSRLEQLDAEQSVRMLTSILQEKGLIDGTEAAWIQSGVEAVPANTRPTAQNQSVAAIVQPPHPVAAAQGRAGRYRFGIFRAIVP